MASPLSYYGEHPTTREIATSQAFLSSLKQLTIDNLIVVKW